MPEPSTKKFALGAVYSTPGALEVFHKHAESPLSYLNRHQAGDWGIADAQDNNRALKNGERLLSAYMVRDTKIWIITEYDRSLTTILLPEEY